MTTFYTLLTKIGAAEFVNAKAAGVDLPFSGIALGDGNGAAVVPDEGMKSLVREVHRVPITSITKDTVNPNWLLIEAVVPTSVGGWTVREIALIGGTGEGGKTLAVGNFPETYKPVLSQGSGRDLVIRMVIQVGNAAIVKLTIDPSVVLATNQAIANAIAAHEGAPDPHPQYAKQSALQAHLIAINPHPQYALLSDLAQHVLAADPHPQYMPRTEAAPLLGDLQAQINKKANSGLVALALMNQGIY